MLLEMNVMSETLYTVYLAGQGETAWSILGQHTVFADLPLTERGRRNATRLGERPNGMTFARIFTSPLQFAPHHLRAGGFWRIGQSDRASSNGTMANTRAGARARSSWSVPVGNCSANGRMLQRHTASPYWWPDAPIPS